MANEFGNSLFCLSTILETSLKKLSGRRETAEHPFGKMKRAFNQGYLLLKRLRKVRGESDLKCWLTM
jgi:hypothetical protein